MPELRLVVLALQDRLAYGPTFESGDGQPVRQPAVVAAPTALRPPQLARSPAPGARATSQPAAPATPADADALISEAARDLADYQRLTAEGKLGEAGQRLEALKQKLEQLAAQKALNCAIEPHRCGWRAVPTIKNVRMNHAIHAARSVWRSSSAPSSRSQPPPTCKAQFRHRPTSPRRLPTAAKTASGLASKVIKPGTGKAHPGKSDLVTVHYTGWTTDGKMFDSSKSAAASRPRSRSIA